MKYRTLRTSIDKSNSLRSSSAASLFIIWNYGFVYIFSLKEDDEN